MTDDEFISWLHRQGKPETKAREARFYQDPAKSIRFDREKGKGMQRDIDEVEALLDLWADWMRKPELPVEGYPSEAPGFLTGSLKDNEELRAVVDAEQIERVDAAFDSLAPLYRDAIMRHYKLGSQVFRFAKAASFEDAKIMARVKFVKKGLL